MRIYHRSELLVHTTILNKTSGIVYKQYWVLDYKGLGYPERVMELITFGRNQSVPLKNKLLLIHLPKIKNLWMRELWILLDEESRRNEAYLARVWNLITKQLNAYLNNEPLPTLTKRNDGYTWIRVRSRYGFLGDILWPWWNENGDNDLKPP